MYIGNFKGLNSLPYADKIQNFMHDKDLKTSKCGRYDLGNDCFAVITEYETKSTEKIVFEAHKKYVDVQYLVFGEEIIYLTEEHMSICTKTYDEDEDYALYESKVANEQCLKQGEYIVLLPHDLHAPSHCTKKTPQKVKKIVFKLLYI